MNAIEKKTKAGIGDILLPSENDYISLWEAAKWKMNLFMLVMGWIVAINWILTSPDFFHWVMKSEIWEIGILIIMLIVVLVI